MVYGICVGRDHVLDAHLDRIAADRARDLVDRALDREAGAGAADAAIGAERRLVGRDRVGLHAVVADVVGPGQVARRHVGLLERTVRPHPIGAGIDDDLGVDAEDAPAPVGIGGDPVVVVAGMGGGEQMLVAILDPAHRMIELERQRGDRVSSGESRAFGPKPPPTSGATTRMQRSSMPSISASATRMVCGVWVEA